MDEEKNKQESFLKRSYKYMGIMAIMLAIILLAIGTFVTQPAVPKASNVYLYMQNNFNASLAKYQGVANITVYNNTIHIVGNPIENLSSVTVNLQNISSSGKTYVFFYGIESSGQSAVETYVLWNYLTKDSFPQYSGSFESAQASIPIIPQSYLLGNVSSSNPVLVELVVPLTYQQAASQSNSTNTNFTAKWLSYNLTLPEAYVFADFGKGNLPQVDIVRTIGNRTMVCNAFSPFDFILYNATSSTKFLGVNTEGQTFGSLLPTPQSINANLNTLNNCVQKVENWTGN